MYMIALFLVLVIAVEPGQEYMPTQHDILFYLPASDEIGDCEPVGVPQKYVGEDLYLYINGGAVIYYEYGFRQVVTQEYRANSGKVINLEIFEMENPASAFGIYTFKTGDDGKEIPVGSEALLEDYYLNFWKGNFVVTLTAVDSEKETIDLLMRIADIVDTKIKSEAEKPKILDLLLKENLKMSSIKYLEGNLALSNNYEFDSENIFGLKEGIIGEYGDFKVFIFRYNNEDESIRWFGNARNHLKDSSRFDYFTGYAEDFSLIDREGKQVYIRPHRNYLLIILGAKENDSRIILEKLEKKIKSIQF